MLIHIIVYNIFHLAPRDPRYALDLFYETTDVSSVSDEDGDRDGKTLRRQKRQPVNVYWGNDLRLAIREAIRKICVKKNLNLPLIEFTFPHDPQMEPNAMPIVDLRYFNDVGSVDLTTERSIQTMVEQKVGDVVVKFVHQLRGLGRSEQVFVMVRSQP